jgi:hypothetical protein
MPHYPGHLREAFVDWLEAGCPPDAVVDDVTYRAETFRRVLPSPEAVSGSARGTPTAVSRRRW